jgi:hypothetical protein
MMRTQTTVVESVLNGQLEFNRMSPSGCLLISDPHSKAILTVHIILVSVSGTVGELSRTFGLRLNITRLPPRAAILKVTGLTAAAFTFLVDGLLLTDRRREMCSLREMAIWWDCSLTG